MIQRPAESEATPYHFMYINRVAGDDPVEILGNQLNGALTLFEGISEQASLHRYEPGKWSIREVLSHVTDTERIFACRMLWAARGLEAPLPGFDQDVTARGTEANTIPWSAHVQEFREVRLSTLSLVRNIPPDGWLRSGIFSDNRVTVRAMAWLIPGHVEHHLAILRERYL